MDLNLVTLRPGLALHPKIRYPDKAAVNEDGAGAGFACLGGANWRLPEKGRPQRRLPRLSKGRDSQGGTHGRLGERKQLRGQAKAPGHAWMRVADGVAEGEANVPHAEGVAGSETPQQVALQAADPLISEGWWREPLQGAAGPHGAAFVDAVQSNDFSSARRAYSFP